MKKQKTDLQKSFEKLVDDVKKGLSASEIQMIQDVTKKMVDQVGPRCDLCSIELKEKENHIISPEKMTDAIKKGLIPPKEEYKDLEIKEMWKYAGIQSETPWALCDTCNIKFLDVIEKFGNVKIRK